MTDKEIEQLEKDWKKRIRKFYERMTRAKVIGKGPSPFLFTVKFNEETGGIDIKAKNTYSEMILDAITKGLTTSEEPADVAR